MKPNVAAELFARIGSTAARRFRIGAVCSPQKNRQRGGDDGPVAARPRCFPRHGHACTSGATPGPGREARTLLHGEPCLGIALSAYDTPWHGDREAACGARRSLVSSRTSTAARPATAAGGALQCSMCTPPQTGGGGGAPARLSRLTDPACCTSDPSRRTSDPPRHTFDPTRRAFDPSRHTTDPSRRMSDPSGPSSDPARHATCTLRPGPPGTL